ncbi:hypothetical protein [Streptomyces sp. BRA346]|uniref:hypothetical protein n=1 Tax=Streptomyces sp. BRA346 TaxID=2878199 RepID=UPI004062D46C
MPSVLLPGLDPRLAPGMDTDAVLALIDTDMARLREHGANTHPGDSSQAARRRL